jgi:hypothetical protein
MTFASIDRLLCAFASLAALGVLLDGPGHGAAAEVGHREPRQREPRRAARAREVSRIPARADPASLAA